MTSLVPVLDTFFATPFDSLFDLPRTNARWNSRKESNLTVDIVDNKENYEVRIPVAGLSKDNIKIQLDGRRLSVSYTKQETNESYYLKESYTESSSRSLILPSDMDENNISTASVSDGILKFTIGKLSKPLMTSKTIAIE